MTSHLLKTLREVLMDAVHVSFDFFKVLIPISIAMKILAELDWIRYLALPLEPVMQLTGLPADLGIAWATGIMVNFYSALIVFIGLLPGLPPLTTEQVTTLAVMMLIAHSIPAEGRIAAQCGVSFIGQAVIRLVVAVIGGVIVHTSCQAFGWLDTPARIAFTPSPDVNLLWWALGEVRNLVSIFCVIFFVMLLQRFLRYLSRGSGGTGARSGPAGTRYAPRRRDGHDRRRDHGHRLRQRRHPQGSPQRRDVPARRVFLHDPDGARARHH